MATTKKKGQSKTDAIRALLESSPELSPKEMAAKLTSKGTKVTPAYVSTIKSSLKKYRTVSRRPSASRSTQSKAGSDGHVAIDALVEAKSLVEKAGGVDEARKALEVLSKLQ